MKKRHKLLQKGAINIQSSTGDSVFFSNTGIAPNCNRCHLCTKDITLKIANMNSKSIIINNDNTVATQVRSIFKQYIYTKLYFEILLILMLPKIPKKNSANYFT